MRWVPNKHIPHQGTVLGDLISVTTKTVSQTAADVSTFLLQGPSQSLVPKLDSKTLMAEHIQALSESPH